jgi:pimeloyl-ACP methyl ester carboxylesterase
MKSSFLSRVLLGLFGVQAGCVVAPLSVRIGNPPFRARLAVAEPRAMVAVEGISLAVFDSDPLSTKPVMVCLHAIAHGGSDFAKFQERFASRYRIIIVDWPGHGASESDAQPASVDRYALLLLGLLDILHVKQAVVFGNSIGGGAAVRFAASHPERVSALMLCNPAGFDSGGFLATLFIGHLKSRFQWGILGQERFAAWFEGYYSSILVTAEASEQRSRIVKSGYEMAPLLYEAWDSFSKPEAYLGTVVPLLTMPVFVGWADRDGLVQWSRNRETIEKIPHLTIRHFDAGHTPFIETPQAFNDEAQAFLDLVFKGVPE